MLSPVVTDAIFTIDGALCFRDATSGKDKGVKKVVLSLSVLSYIWTLESDTDRLLQSLFRAFESR